MVDCPTDCAWGEWSEWSSCSATCGGGTQYATRNMARHVTGGGEQCEGEPLRSQQCGITKCVSGHNYVLSSTGRAAEHQGARLGIYEEIDHEYGSRVFRQRGGTLYIYKKDDKWWCGSTVGAYTGSFYTTDLFSKTGEWYYWDGAYQKDDQTLQFLPLSPTSCIIQPSILITSTGPANSIWPDYLGSFTLVPGVFSAGRPVWRNTKGKVLMIRPGITHFGVYDGIESTGGSYVRSLSGPTCPTDIKAGHNDRKGRNAWWYYDGGKWVEDAILVQ